MSSAELSARDGANLTIAEFAPVIPVPAGRVASHTEA
jgi:hypothetical protein